MDDELHKQLIKDLLIESFEGLDVYDREMLAIEEGSSDRETMNVIFRAIHTIKGTSGCLGLSKIESVAHVGENVLSMLREGQLNSSSDLVTTLLSLSDALREMLQFLDENGTEGDGDYSDLLAKLQGFQKQASESESETSNEEQGFGLFADEEAPAAEAPAAEAPAAEAAPVEEAGTFGLFADEEPAPVAVESPLPAAAVGPVPTTQATTKESGKAGSRSVSDSAIRVEVDQLDKLMNLVGELVLSRNQIIQHTSSSEESALVAASQRLNIITTELQESIMKTRMQPIGNIWAKFPRIVRDVSHELGKKVRLQMEGNETELDRTVIEAIKDPLTHIVRNSIDHGMELPDERVELGKKEEGLLLLRAFHEGGQVNIEISDDGRGINPEKIKAKAIERGLVASDQAARLSQREVLNLIFAPGFSTAEKVTNISGRGVGMDVVRTNIEKIGGSVDIQSDYGKGTTIRIKIPLTLAIIPALIVDCSGDRYAIPQASLVELVRLESGELTSSVEYIHDSPVYRLRGNLLPLVCLGQELQLTKREDCLQGGDEAEDSSMLIVVLQAEDRQFGLVVDNISDTEEIVVKPLGKELKGLPVYAGATIMGDGRVGLILDVFGIARKANVIQESGSGKLKKKESERSRPTVSGDLRTLLLFGVGEDHQVAIPLSSVARLEEFPIGAIERAGNTEVVQYRDEIMPLVRVSDALDVSPDGAEETMVKVVVYSTYDRSVGLVVDRILDVVEETVQLQESTRRPGISGSAVVQKRVTDFLDVEGLIASVDFEMLSTRKTLN